MGQTKNIRDNNVAWDKINRIADIAAVCRALPQEKNGLAKVLQLIQGIVVFDAATLYLLHRDRDRLEIAASLGGRVELLSFLSVGAGQGLSGWTAHNRKPLLLSERSSISSFDPDSEYATFLSLPLLAGEELIGVLNLGSGKARAFTDDDVKLLTIVADQLALSIERMNYQKRVKSISSDLQQTREQLQQVQTKKPATDRWGEIAPLAAGINHGINNALSVIVGNVQCLLWERVAANQKSLSRLRRIESAALQISSLNHKVLELRALVQSSSPSAQGGEEINLTRGPHESM